MHSQIRWIQTFTRAILLLLASTVPAAAQTLIPTPYQTVLDNSGHFVSGACVWTYLAGTTTAATTYTDAGLTTPNTNPIVTDSAGRWTAYLTAGQGYKIVVENTPCSAISHGVVLKSVDNVKGVPTSDVTSQRDLAEGRLTLTSGTPVTTADVSAGTTIYYTPFVGNRISLYDGSASWNVRSFTEVAISIVACTASKPYDVWLYDNAGVVTGEILVWTNSTTRATALTRQDGIYVKTGDSTRRYVGTFYCNASGGQTDDTAAKRYVWNYYNRAKRLLVVADSTDSWTYTTATYRQANNSTANQVDVIVGVADVLIDLTVLSTASNSAIGNGYNVGIGEDSTTTLMASQLYVLPAQAVAGVQQVLMARGLRYPAVGRHFYAWLEIGNGGGTTTWYGDQGGTLRSGLTGSIEG